MLERGSPNECRGVPPDGRAPGCSAIVETKPKSSYGAGRAKPPKFATRKGSQGARP